MLKQENLDIPQQEALAMAAAAFFTSGSAEAQPISNADSKENLWKVNRKKYYS
jgi:hypothetical protein